MNDNLPTYTPDPMTFIREGVDDLGVYLAMWANRDDSPASARAAAGQAVERIDVTLQRLHRLREQLVAEIRESDDAAMKRSAELLQRIRDERAAATAGNEATPRRDSDNDEPNDNLGD